MEDGEKIEEALRTRRYVTHWPGTRKDMLMQYPDLRNIPSFKRLGEKPKELVFVWWYCSKCSPAMDLVDDKDRIELAMRASWGDPVPKEVIERFRNKKWGEDVSAAIADMQKIDPLTRIRTKLIIQRSMRNIQEILDVDASDLKGKEWSEKKEYVDTVAKAASVIVTLQRASEGDLGVSEVEEKDYKPGEVMQRLHSQPIEEL